MSGAIVKLPPNPETNPDLDPNSNPNRGQFSSWGNYPDTVKFKVSILNRLKIMGLFVNIK